MKPIKRSTIKRTAGIFVHITAWLYIFISPLLFSRHSESIDWARYCRGLVFPLSTCILFYANYLWLIPRFILQHKIKLFLFWNALLLLAMTGGMEYFMQITASAFPPRRPRLSAAHHFPKIFFVLRGVTTQIFCIVVAVTIRLSMQWRHSELARLEAEQGRAEAELKHLKNQISPHFLLNTLNNIYALAAIDSEKTQQAILELSRMLRFLLYENPKNFISLRKEAEFLQTYISLMQLRVARDVDIRFSLDLPEDGTCPDVAPLIFISLVENAFKHGISPTNPSFIHISLSAKPEEGYIRFTVRNSNYPKTQQDKSGSGIGLQQVSRRLQLAYPNRHTWYHGPSPDGHTYLSSILIGQGTA